MVVCSAMATMIIEARSKLIFHGSKPPCGGGAINTSAREDRATIACALRFHGCMMVTEYMSW